MMLAPKVYSGIGISGQMQHGGREPRGHDVCRTRTRTPHLQAVRLRPGGRPEGTSCRGWRRLCRLFRPVREGALRYAQSLGSPRFAVELAWWARRATSSIHVKLPTALDGGTAGELEGCPERGGPFGWPLRLRDAREGRAPLLLREERRKKRRRDKRNVAETDFDAIVVGSWVRGRRGGLRAREGRQVDPRGRARHFCRRERATGKHLLAQLEEGVPDFESEAPWSARSPTSASRSWTRPRRRRSTSRARSSRRRAKDLTGPARAPSTSTPSSRGRHAEYICGIAAEELLKDGSGRSSARRRRDEITAEATIVAEGRTMLCERSLGNPRSKPPRWRSGDHRCSSCRPPRSRTASPCLRARARRCCSSATARTETSAEASVHEQGTLSVSLVATVSTAMDASEPYPVPDARGFQEPLPAVAPVIRGAKLVEHSGHGARRRPRYGPGSSRSTAACGRRVGRPLHEHGLPGARHGLRRIPARWRAVAVVARSTRATRARWGSPPTRRR